MEFLSNYGLFLAKTVTLLAALLAVVGFIATLAMRRRSATPEYIEVKPINDHYRDISDVLQHSMLRKNEAKKKRKADKKARKAEPIPPAAPEPGTSETSFFIVLVKMSE